MLSEIAHVSIGIDWLNRATVKEIRLSSFSRFSKTSGNINKQTHWLPGTSLYDSNKTNG